MVKLKKLRPRCFFDITIGGENVGRIIFELFDDVCPKTCENFKALCTGEKGIGKKTGKPLHYKGVIFHRVVKGFMVQSGDFSHGDGKGGESIYGGTFEDESFEMKHDKPMLLSMANRGKAMTNGSQFFITLARTPHLDGVHVVFGHVISGHEVVSKIGNQPVDKNDKPLAEVCIANCGELIPQIKSKSDSKKGKLRDSDSESASSSEDDSSSDDDSDTDSSDSSKDEQRKSAKDQQSRESEKEEGEVVESEPKETVLLPFNNLKHNVKINPDEIPEVPQNRFLSRNFYPPKDKEAESGGREERRQFNRQNFNVRRFDYSNSGRKVKGRGSIRYRTPSPDDRHHHSRFRRSETPPHWRTEQAKLKPFKQVIAQSRDNSDDRSEDQDKLTSDQRPAYGRRYGYKSRDYQNNHSSYSREKDYRRNGISFRRGYSNSNDRNRNRSRSNSKEVKEKLDNKDSNANSRNRSRSSSTEARRRLVEASGDENVSSKENCHDPNRNTNEESRQKDSISTKHRKNKSRSRSKERNVGDVNIKDRNGARESDSRKLDREYNQKRRPLEKERSRRSSTNSSSPEVRKKSRRDNYKEIEHSRRDRRSTERHRQYSPSRKKRDYSPEKHRLDRSVEEHSGTNGQHKTARDCESQESERHLKQSSVVFK